MRRAHCALVWILAGLALALVLSPAVRSQTSAPQLPASDPAREARLAWWREARFGLFMHWGIYAVPAGEWKGLEKQRDLGGEWIMQRAQIPVKEYELLAQQFNPVKFDAREWVRLAKRTGMRYIVITAKHCDGFAMFASKASKYNIVDATPFARDPMRELAEACRREGIKLGFYYSHSWDWHEPDALGLDNKWDFPDRAKKDINRYLRSKSLPQVEELVTQYRPALMWFDVPNDLTREHSQAFVDIVRKGAPDCIINDRVGNRLGDYDTPERVIPRRPRGDFEVCMPLNEHWGYDKNDHRWKEPPVVIRQLVEIASKGGNYLLNVGPTAEGTFPAQAVRVLTEIGRWMDANGESIHGTSAGPLGAVPWGCSTAKAGTVYLHVFQWPRDGRLAVPGVRANVKRAWLLSDPAHKKLGATRIGNVDWQLRLPAKPADPIDSVVAVELEGPPDADPTTALFPHPDYRYVFGAAAASVQGRGARYEPVIRQRRPYDRIGAWTDPQTGVAWQFRAPVAGSYNVELTYSAAAESAGNAFVLMAGANTLEGKVEPTGGLEEFKTVTLGAVTIQPGMHELTVKPKTIAPGSPLMQLHAVALAPVAAANPR